MVGRIVRFAFSWLPVKPRRVEGFGEYIRASLKEDGYYKWRLIPDDVYTSLSQKAFNRAALKRKDRCVKLGLYFQELDDVVKELEKALDHGVCSDSTVEQILRFNRVI